MNELLKNRLKEEFGLSEEQVAKLEEQGVKVESDLELLTAKDIQDVTGCKLIPAKKIHEAFRARPAIPPVAPAAAPEVMPAAAAAAADAEVPEGANPSPAQINSFATALGVPADMMSMFLMANLAGGSGMDFDISSMFPVATVVAGYNPRLRNPYMMFMGQLERLYGGPIVVINEDGSVNRDLTVKYVDSLEQGDPLAEDDVYYVGDNAYQLVAVGVDAQGVRDADPLIPSKPLPTSGVGTGRVNWNGVGLDARQVVFYAATQTAEVDPNDEAHTSWLRDHVKAGVSRLIFTRQYPKAVQKYNEASRLGTLPMLKVMPARGPRKREVMPRRRIGQVRDLSSLGRSAEGPFRRDDDRSF